MKKMENRQWITRITAYSIKAILVLAMVLAVFAQTTPAAAKVCKFKHKVKAGETLISIGQMYQYDWREIAEASDLKEPYVLSVGLVLCIPGGTKPAETTTTTTTDASGTQTTATVKSSPSLTTGAAMNSVYVKVEGFPKNTPYSVRIQGVDNKGEANGICPLKVSKFNPMDIIPDCQIGRLRTDKVGFYEGWFRIPVLVEQTSKMAVCVKNQLNDNLSCGNFENPFSAYSSYAIANFGCAKWAR